MKILTSKTPPSSNELAETLKRRFSDRYSFKLRGLGHDKNVIVQKSPFVGAQISTSGNEITIEGVQPSILGLFSSLFLNFAYGLSIPLTRSPWKKLEMEIGGFLQQEYN